MRARAAKYDLVLFAIISRLDYQQRISRPSKREPEYVHNPDSQCLVLDGKFAVSGPFAQTSRFWYRLTHPCRIFKLSGEQQCWRPGQSPAFRYEQVEQPGREETTPTLLTCDGLF